MNNLTALKINSKVIWILTLLALGLLGYFIYQGFFSQTETTLNASNNAYVSGSKQGKYTDILNKENLSFQNTIDEKMLLNSEDFSVKVNPSESYGRRNPFLP